jgi:hypothetical protein
MVATLTTLSGVAFLTYTGALSVFVVGTVTAHVVSKIARARTRERDVATPTDPSDPISEDDADAFTVYVEFWRQADASASDVR